MTEGFGVNTYVWVNSEGKRQYVKYHWKPKLGVHNLDRHEATQLAGVDPDYLTRDLWDAITKGGEVEYELCVQLMKIEDELKQDFDPLDPTKTWPEDKFPLMPVGKMVLNRNPKNFFVEVEQAAFCPASIVPGIEFSADKLLQGRTFSYADTQRHRLGPNYLQIPVNRPLVEVNNSQRDGSMQLGEYSGPVNYEPASIAGGSPVEAPSGKPSVYHIEGDVAKKKISKTNDYQQAGEKYRSLSRIDQEHLVDNLIADLTPIDKQVKQRVIANLTKADPELGKSVAKGLKL
jgi:catalase